jgi:hypothetical protein
MSFRELLLRAKGGDESAMTGIIEMYRPLLIRQSVINGMFDEDLHQELWLTLFNCVQKIKI